MPGAGQSLPSTSALLLCYVAFPLSNMCAELLGTNLWRNWIDLAWVALALTLASAGYRARYPARLLPLFILSIGLALWIAAGVIGGSVPTITAGMEIKPVLYLLVALILSGYGPPTPKTFCRMGGWLSALLVSETLVRSLLAGSLERPIGSGEVNYDAALLCLSLVFALGRDDLARRYAPLIFFGLLATFSRTGILAACVVLVFAGKVPLSLRVSMVCAAIGTAFLSFVIRGLDIGSLESMDRYWMWFVGIQHLFGNLASTALVFAPGSGINVDIPRPILELWKDQQENLKIEGIFPFHFHAMWLRLTMAWGWVLPLLLLLMTLWALVSRGRRPSQARALAGAIIVLGLTMGLVYLSNVGVPMILAAFQLFASKSQRPLLPANCSDYLRT